MPYSLFFRRLLLKFLIKTQFRLEELRRCRVHLLDALIVQLVIIVIIAVRNSAARPDDSLAIDWALDCVVSKCEIAH